MVPSDANRSTSDSTPGQDPEWLRETERERQRERGWHFKSGRHREAWGRRVVDIQSSYYWEGERSASSFRVQQAAWERQGENETRPKSSVRPCPCLSTCRLPSLSTKIPFFNHRQDRKLPHPIPFAPISSPG